MRFPDPITHLRSHLGKPELELMRNTALSIAGFSAGLIIFLAQSKGQPSYSPVALWASIVSLLVWLFGAQYISTYLMHGERTYKHINLLLCGFAAVVGYSSLFIAVVATVWRLSVAAGVFLMLFGLVLGGFVFFHSRFVDRICNAPDA